MNFLEKFARGKCFKLGFRQCRLFGCFPCYYWDVAVCGTRGTRFLIVKFLFAFFALNVQGCNYAFHAFQDYAFREVFSG